MRAAVIGAGQISKQHLGALSQCDDVRVVGVCDLSPVMAESTAHRFGIGAWFTDYRQMLDEQRPDVVHVLTPASTHFAIAGDCLRSGAHALVEKPITEEFAQLEELIGIAQRGQKQLLEDHNYQFNRDVQSMLGLVQQGRLGQVRHVDIDLCLAVFGEGSRFADVGSCAGGHHNPSAAIRDFLTHLCCLAYAFIGDHRRVHTTWRLSPCSAGMVVDNLQALVEGQLGTARIGFSADSRPDTFTIRVQGTRMRLETNLFEVGVLNTELLGGPKPLMQVRNMLRRGRAEWWNAGRSLSRKLSGGPGAYEGMWELIRRFYDSLRRGEEPPASAEQIRAVNALYHDILREVPVSCTC